ncbi:hypothetical protein ACFQE1_12915, partial [Halobium palmae]
MSATHTGETEVGVGCRPAEVEAVEIEAESLESTATDYLRGLKTDLAAGGVQPATVSARATFDEDCSFAVQREADRLRELVHAAAFLGAGEVVVDVDVGRGCGREKFAPALRALGE